jgi:uncharacterized protein YcaQ
MSDSVWSNRHPSVRHFEPLFAYDHLPPHLREVSQQFGELAERLLVLLPDDSPEVSAGLRKLVEAKDCAVRARFAERARAAALAKHGVEHVDLKGDAG